MEPKSNSIELSTFLKHCLTEVKKPLVDVRLGSKYASLSITLNLTFLKRTKFIAFSENFLWKIPLPIPPEEFLTLNLGGTHQ